MDWIRNDRQLELVRRHLKGHFVVLGAAGTGKSIIAIAKILDLQKMLLPSKKILFVTFNKALIKYAKSVLTDMVLKTGEDYLGVAPVTVCNYHKLAFEILGINRNKIVKDSYYRNSYVVSKRELIQQAIGNWKDKEPANPLFKRPIETFVSEISFLEKFGFDSYETYNRAERIGRKSVNAARGEVRQGFWHVYEEYLALRSQNGFLCDFDDMAKLVFERFQQFPIPASYKYDYILVDEGQDMSPMMIKTLLMLLNDKSEDDNYGFMFFGDADQQIYGSKLSWKDIGLHISGSNIERLTQSYRYTEEIAQLALDITQSEYWDRDTPDMVLPEHNERHGTMPRLIRYQNFTSELAAIKKLIQANMSAQTNTCIILPTRKAVFKWLANLTEAGLKVQEISGDMDDYNIHHPLSVSTFHSVKGFEFDHVIIPDLDAGNFPVPQSFKGVDDETDVYDIACKLLYVGVTRAKASVTVTYLKKLTPVFPYKEHHFVEEGLEPPLYPKGPELVKSPGVVSTTEENKLPKKPVSPPSDSPAGGTIKKVVNGITKILVKERAKGLRKEEILAYFEKGLHEAKKEIDILSPWIAGDVVDGRMIDMMERLLIHKVTIKILYGIGDPHNKLNKKDLETSKMAERLQKYFNAYPNFKIKRTDSHGKLLIVDDRFLIETSLNLLSYRGQGTRQETGVYLTDKDLIEEDRRMYFNF